MVTMSTVAWSGSNLSGDLLCSPELGTVNPLTSGDDVFICVSASWTANPRWVMGIWHPPSPGPVGETFATRSGVRELARSKARMCLFSSGLGAIMGAWYVWGVGDGLWFWVMTPFGGAYRFQV